MTMLKRALSRVNTLLGGIVAIVRPLVIVSLLCIYYLEIYMLIYRCITKCAFNYHMAWVVYS